jgi:hypothetical protein
MKAAAAVCVCVCVLKRSFNFVALDGWTSLSLLTADRIEFGISMLIQCILFVQFSSWPRQVVRSSQKGSGSGSTTTYTSVHALLITHKSLSSLKASGSTNRPAAARRHLLRLRDDAMPRDGHILPGSRENVTRPFFLHLSHCLFFCFFWFC